MGYEGLFEGYVIERKLGNGGFGVVFLARRVSDGRQVAIKCLLPEHTSNDAVLERFVGEAHILGRFRATPNVVTLIDAELDGPIPYIVMEYCDGGALDEWLKLPVSPDSVVYAVAEAAKGLAEVHQQGGVHRDVKPHNILLGARASVKVTDFGVSRHPDVGGAMTRSAQGTNGYLAPELFAGEPYTSACDVYSLGITAIQLLTKDLNPLAAMRPEVPVALRPLLMEMVGVASRRPTMAQVASRMEMARRQLTPPSPANHEALAAVALLALGFVVLSRLK